MAAEVKSFYDEMKKLYRGMEEGHLKLKEEALLPLWVDDQFCWWCRTWHRKPEFNEHQSKEHGREW